MFYDKPDLINTRAESIAKVTAADVQRVARQYLVKTGRTVVTTDPKAAPAKGGHVMTMRTRRSSRWHWSLAIVTARRRSSQRLAASRRRRQGS